MIRTCAALVLATLVAGCVTPPKASSVCRVPGCIQPDAEDTAPIGAKLEFSQCALQQGALNTFKYVKVESGWRLVFYESVVSGKCRAGDGS